MRMHKMHGNLFNSKFPSNKLMSLFQGQKAVLEKPVLEKPEGKTFGS